MKNKLILTIFFSLVLSLCFAQKAKTEPEHKFKLYKPQEYSNIQRNVESINDGSLLFIMDFSNSMNNPINGIAKIDMARNTLAEILPKVPSNVKTGLRVYGHKTGFTYYHGCQASELTVPLNYNNFQTILVSLYATSARGWTPITYSLKQAIEKDFINTTGKKHIILLTDGGENCDESPCTYVINLMKTRNDITIDVIAFDVHDIEANNQLRCTALMTSGKFLNADTQEDLANSLFETLGISKDVKGSIKIPAQN